LTAIEADEKNVTDALEKIDSWNDLQQFFTQSSFVRLSGKKVECDRDKKETVKTLRDSYKERWNDMKTRWFSRSLTGHVEDMRDLAPVIRKLTQLVKEFAIVFTE